ncbi:hypothetical protein G4H71_09075 [Rhodococcus triatomae]|uniref:Uncharacterized protein n=1 Tax=Rhodococcus triatomae TaxID=300028 RepID=A0A1G8I0R0_9NOCA|nr:hypothetical protein [Rhodococcus triatomae]QNG20922.1 hypothetical protein G4H72_21310 [Rhodococcus triatomae]QNG23163.1 hypothetical protein G4H71_09075 [Rhodococcus triatomae]SDI12331.1 hypothetical protein SAMN05444695_105120 [Rhodococcus triatomae]
MKHPARPDESEYLLGTTGGHLAVSTGLIVTVGAISAVFAGIWIVMAVAATLAGLWLGGHGIAHLVHARPRLTVPAPARDHRHLPHAA